MMRRPIEISPAGTAGLDARHSSRTETSSSLSAKSTAKNPVTFSRDKHSFPLSPRRSSADASRRDLAERLGGRLGAREGSVAEHLCTEELEAIESGLRLSYGRISGPNFAANRLGCFDTRIPIKCPGIDKFSFRE